MQTHFLLIVFLLFVTSSNSYSENVSIDSNNLVGEYLGATKDGVNCSLEIKFHQLITGHKFYSFTIKKEGKRLKIIRESDLEMTVRKGEFSTWMDKDGWVNFMNSTRVRHGETLFFNLNDQFSNVDYYIATDSYTNNKNRVVEYIKWSCYDMNKNLD